MLRNLRRRAGVEPFVQSPLPKESAFAVRRVHALVNPTSGGVGADAAEEIRDLLAGLGLDHQVTELEPRTCRAAVRAALAAGPDLVVVLGGDGTARLVAETAGPAGPLVAPLSGGTMNKLGRALYGDAPWRDALTDALQRGRWRWVPAGEAAGRAFFCGAVLGSPALLAPAREAIRAHDLRRAFRRALVATRKAAISRLSFEVDGRIGHGAALSLLCPTVARAPHAAALKAAVLDPPPAARASGGVRLALAHLMTDWREDPESAMPCVKGRAWARSPIPMMLDGEFFRAGRRVDFRFRPRAFRALAPPPAAPAPP